MGLVLFLKNEIGYREGIVYRKFMLVPAMLAWAFSNAMWIGVTLMFFRYDGLTFGNAAQYASILVLAYWLVPPATRRIYANLSGLRMWNWGRSRFYSKRHMAAWMHNVGNDIFELVVLVDERLKAESDFLKLMRP